MEESCEKALGAIEDLGDGDLGRVKWLLLKRHARKCGGCRAYLKRMEAVLEALAELGRVSAPEDLIDAVMACLLSTVTPLGEYAEAEVHGHRNLLLVAGAAGLGVAVAVALAIVRWVVGREEEESLAPIGTA
jgi:hypothetical protein